MSGSFLTNTQMAPTLSSIIHCASCEEIHSSVGLSVLCHLSVFHSENRREKYYYRFGTVKQLFSARQCCSFSLISTTIIVVFFFYLCLRQQFSAVMKLMRHSLHRCRDDRLFRDAWDIRMHEMPLPDFLALAVGYR